MEAIYKIYVPTFVEEMPGTETTSPADPRGAEEWNAGTLVEPGLCNCAFRCAMKSSR